MRSEKGQELGFGRSAARAAREATHDRETGKDRNALGGETELVRGDGRFPALVTRVIHPAVDGKTHVQLASYTERGNLETSTEVSPYGDGRNAVTRYGYDDTTWPNFVSKIVPPMGDSVMFGYDSNGNRAWQEDARGITSRTNYFYHTNDSIKGLLAAVKAPLTPADSVYYDALGNLARTRSPIGFYSLFYKDNLGRDTLVITPTDSASARDTTQLKIKGVQKWIRYDLADRVLSDSTVGPAMNDEVEQAVLVTNIYDAEGRPKSLSRSSIPNSAGVGVVTNGWEYDRAGRVVKEIATDGAADSTIYDPAGNPIRVITRRGDTISIIMEYDALGRLKKRKTSAVEYGERIEGIADGNFITAWQPNDPNRPYPWYPTGSTTNYRIEADSAVFEYDAHGNLKQANNSDAQVSRTHYPGGALMSETQKIRTVTGSDFSKHVYQLEYRYDLNGRRTNLIHPRDLRAGTARDGVLYTYSEQSGLLETVTDLLGNVFTYSYDAESRIKSLAHPGGIVENYSYDNDGRRISHRIDNGSNATYKYLGPTLRMATFRYDARGKLIHTGSTTGQRDTTTALYSGLGHIIDGGTVSHSAGRAAHYSTFETIAYDALGNKLGAVDRQSYVRAGYLDHRPSAMSHQYISGVGRLASTRTEYETDTMYYDASGNLEFSTTSWTAPGKPAQLRDRASYYDAEGRLRAVDARTVKLYLPDIANSSYTRSFEEYRYDALGRRIWVRARRNCMIGHFEGSCQLSKIKRVVWDGNQELYEIQMPGWDGSPDLESDTVPTPMGIFHNQKGTILPFAIDPNPFFGRVAYVHGHALDQPLGIIRMGYGDVQDSAGYVLSHQKIDPFLIVPLWNERGQATNGVFEDGGVRKCKGNRCVFLFWPEQWFAYVRPQVGRSFWHGSLIEDKQDASGTHYRRNRYYDPDTGQFTQEDPIGLAGGLNLYGYAGGDPVNFSDPFGLCRQWTGIFKLLNVIQPACKTTDEAARRAFVSIRRKYMSKYLEFGGEIVADPNGGFRYVKPRTDGSRVKLDIYPSVEGYEGAYHNHPPTPGYIPNQFSDADKDLADKTGKPIYMLTPSGVIMRYSPDPERKRGGNVETVH